MRHRSDLNSHFPFTPKDFSEDVQITANTEAADGVTASLAEF